MAKNIEKMVGEILEVARAVPLSTQEGVKKPCKESHAAPAKQASTGTRINAPVPNNHRVERRTGASTRNLMQGFWENMSGM